MQKALVVRCWIFLLGIVVPTLAAAQAERPNVVFIMADDLGWSDTTLFGTTDFYETPHIERLAARGMLFTNAYSASPLCSPTRGSIMSGWYPARLGITRPQTVHDYQAKLAQTGPAHRRCLVAESARFMPKGNYTLAHALHDVGYTCGHFGKWHLGAGENSPLSKGFDVDVPHHPGGAPNSGYLAPWTFLGEDRTFKGRPEEHLEDRMAQEAVAFMKARARQGKPFFLNYWAYSIHSPWSAKSELVEKYQQKIKPNSPQRNAVYAAMVESLDDAVGTLLEALDELDIADRTIVIFFSDNGGNTWPPPRTSPPGFEHVPGTNSYPLRSGKGSLYEGGTRVPLIVTWPGQVRGGTTSDALFSSVDFYPTLLDMLQIDKKPGLHFDGVSLKPALLGKKGNRDTVFCYHPHYDADSPGAWVRQGDWKLIRFFCDNLDQTDRVELYNLREDVCESRSFTKRFPEKTKEMSQLLDAYLEKTGAIVPEPNPAYKVNSLEDADSVTIDHLKDNRFTADPTAAGKQRPDYPLYAAFFGDDHSFTESELRTMAQAFEFVYGGPTLSASEMQRAREIYPDIQFIKYLGNWKALSSWVKDDHHRQVQYYQGAVLAETIDQQQSFRLDQAPNGLTLGLKPGIWIRIDDELMQVEAYDAATQQVEVTRNWDGQGQAAHASGTPVLVPACGPQMRSFHHDPAAPGRWDQLYQGLVRFREQGGDGIWIDILMDNSLRPESLHGELLKYQSFDGEARRLYCWNFGEGRPYFRDEYRQYNEAGIDGMQSRFKQAFGHFPVIYANNMMASRFEDGVGGHKYYLYPTELKQRPLDGMCMEDALGGYSREQWRRWRQTGAMAPDKAMYAYYGNYKNWNENIQTLMKCAQRKLAALPLIINAGMKTEIFEHLDDATRRDYEQWAYASYLLTVEVFDGHCPTKLGLPLFHYTEGQRRVFVDPMYFWPIGTPQETVKPEFLYRYKHPGTEVYQRHFTGGLVLVNPSTTEHSVTLAGQYWDPEAQQACRTMTLKPQTGKILLTHSKRNEG